MITKKQAKLGALRGGHARAKALSPERRKEIARMGWAARWGKPNSLPEQAQKPLLAKEIKAMREAAGVTQNEAARRLGVARSTYATLEQGRQPITLAMSDRIRKVLELKTEKT